MIKEYFANYFLHMSDITIDMNNNSVEVHQKKAESWKITLIDTGENTQTGGRLKRVASYLDDDFCMTYGDGVGSIDIAASIAFHRQHGKLATMTAVQPPGRFGAMEIEGTTVKAFIEKPQGDGGRINGGFFVLNPKVLDLISSDATIWEKEPLESLAWIPCVIKQLLKSCGRAVMHPGKIGNEFDDESTGRSAVLVGQEGFFDWPYRL